MVQEDFIGQKFRLPQLEIGWKCIESPAVIAQAIPPNAGSSEATLVACQTERAKRVVWWGREAGIIVIIWREIQFSITAFIAHLRILATTSLCLTSRLYSSGAKIGIWHSSSDNFVFGNISLEYARVSQVVVMVLVK